MANYTIGDYTAAVSIDGSTHYLLIQPGNSSVPYKKINRATLLGISGSPVGTSDTQNLTNKTLDNTSTITLKDTLFTLQDDSDTTKQLKLQLSGFTTATTRTITIPDATDTMVNLTSAQTLTNKTLTAPKILTSILDTSGATLIGITTTGSAVNYVNVANAATGNVPVISVGGDANRNLKITGAGTGGLTPVIPYDFKVYRNAALNAGNNAFAVVTFDTADYDTGSNVDIVTNKGRFTAPIAGKYTFKARVSTTSTSTAQTIIASIYKNGSEYSRGTQIVEPSSGAPMSSVVSDDLILAANDYVEIYCFGTVNFALDVGTTFRGTRFSGYLVSV